ncbi:hypothetical protein A3F32_01590 [Candidatus Roizmanbacteria bacterium RIFCSPHIGHO2_12_FULL_42_10]|uniref:Glycosyltransferase subfamily 4-like N-terminal domain-containing protein n=1 Tax=Candidatus Roizmanbacteria bacterium RIFCSPHIGHO2_12_FULL_42_10 TaxID=1802053 RepID=A0A1F7I382_9BACT|nr:MAG: hypothetical protein A3F32_01590 [Candidatus Roizmanbacteria bacterium RIFCSPHIGHO2_12_FULL_42_10]
MKEQYDVRTCDARSLSHLVKILFLTRRAYPHIGGVEKHTLKVAQELTTRGHTVTILAENHDPLHLSSGQYTFHSVDFNFFSCGRDSFLKKFHIWWWMIKNVRVFALADVIHIHDIVIWYLPLRFLLFWKPVYATFHGYEGVFPPTRKAIFLRRLSELLTSKTIDVGAYLHTWYGTHPDEVMYGGIDNIDFSPTSGRHVVLVGRLEKDIGMELYIKFFRKLKGYTIDIYGDGSYRSSLLQYGTVHGFVKNSEKFIKNADIVCASSYLTILEALAFGKRVVALYDNPLKKDYLEQAPFAKWLYLADNPEKLPDFKKFSQKELGELQSVLQTMTWHHVTDIYESLWKK